MRHDDWIVAPGWEPVATVFGALIEADDLGGAAVAVHADGKLVLDAWGGRADAVRDRDWHGDTPTVVFSCTKGMLSILVAKLVESGAVRYEQPVSELWPEFAAAGKGEVRIADVLSHRAGLPAFDVPIGFEELVGGASLPGLLARQTPRWRPSDGYAYHPLTFGWLVGEIVRRATEETIGRYFTKTLADPLGLDAWIGAPPHVLARVAHVKTAPSQVAASVGLLERAESGDALPLFAMTLGGALPPSLVGSGAGADAGLNDPRAQAAEIPGAGGIATARALSALWSSTVVGTHEVSALGAGVLAEALAPASEGPQLVAGGAPYPRFGMGFQLTSDAQPYLTARSFGHDGAGGQLAFADPDHGVGFAYVTSTLVGSGDDRGRRLVEAVRSVL
ncbi:MAG TPA: serine hydrolase domain-containing protein [Tepidisphaeraceae bacterium]|nr:serine hydrolase domain-containing protein [Tepidisphaeraceae bacterium]